MLERRSADTVFLGDSLTDVCEWEDLFNDPGIANRAVGGAVTTDMMDVVAVVVPMRPKRIFIMVGGNDFVRGYDSAAVVANYGKLVDVIRKSLPGTKIYIQANLPTRIAPLNEKLDLLRKEIRKMADGRMVFYVDLHPLFSDGFSMLKKELTYDGIHLTGEGYLVWKKALLPYMR
ncbi:MAG: GDSL-type esterase/lipase family protein [Spirochaetes bacterium]|nr:GDSL-type esterase/lipase family protein [Spirochaetota bacterium]